jgi:hypothetical protein
MRACSSVLIACALAAGCTTDPESLTTATQGVAELRVDATSLAATSITRLAVETDGLAQDLVFNQSSGTFDAALILPAGTHTLIARAFSNDVVAGESRPTTVDVQPGSSTRVIMRIVDRRADPQLFGPIFDSLTFPPTAQAATPVAFAIAILAPGGDPVSYEWTSDCADSAFSSPRAAATSWSKPTPGTCRISVRAGSNDIFLTQQFNVVVFPEGSLDGAVDVSGVFVAAPVLDLFLNELQCDAQPGINGSCARETASPTVTNVNVNVFGWGVSTPGPISVTDNCGGRFGLTFQNSDFLQGAWLPPAAGGLCIITARGVNGDGAVGTTSAAVLVRRGTPATSQPPQIVLALPGCQLVNTDPPTTGDCAAMPAGTQSSLAVSLNWGDGLPGSVTLTDDCNPEPFVPPSTNFFTRFWTLPSRPGAVCTVTVHATSLQGADSVVSGRFQLF